MTYPDVYLVQIFNRAYRFTVAAVLAQSEDQAKEMCKEKFGETFGGWSVIKDVGDIKELGVVGSFVFEE